MPLSVFDHGVALRPTARRAPGAGRLGATAVLLVASAVGAVVGVSPAIGVLLALAIVFTLVVAWDLAIGICGFLLLTFIDVVSGDSDVTLTKAAGALLVGAWVAVTATQRNGKRALSAAEPWLVLAVVAFLAWSALSLVWAQDEGAAGSSTLRFALNALLLPIVFAGVRDRRHVVWLLAVFVVGALLSIAWGITHASGANAEEGRLAGARAEANALATLLLVAIVFAGALVYTLRNRPFAVTAGVMAMLLGLTAFFATFSRAGVVGLVAVVLVGVVYGGRLRPALAGFSCVVAVVGLAFFSTTSSGAVERLTTGSTSGRSDIWTVAVRMIDAHPVLGVGSGNFVVTSSQYLLYPGTIIRDEYILDEPLVAHNIYLHVMAEMGIVGLLLFLAVLGLSIRCAVRAVALFESRQERSLEILGRTLVIAIVGVLATDFFASEQYSKQLWVLLALCPALLAIAREGHGDGLARGRAHVVRSRVG